MGLNLLAFLALGTLLVWNNVNKYNVSRIPGKSELLIRIQSFARVFDIPSQLITRFLFANWWVGKLISYFILADVNSKFNTGSLEWCFRFAVGLFLLSESNSQSMKLMLLAVQGPRQIMWRRPCEVKQYYANFSPNVLLMRLNVLWLYW